LHRITAVSSSAGVRD